MASRQKPKAHPNTRLRHQREQQNLTLQEIADKLYDMCIQEGRESGISADTVGRWERGVSKPEAHYRAKLCKLFGKSAAELGLIEQPVPCPETSLVPFPSSLFDGACYNGTYPPKSTASLSQRGGTPAVIQEVPAVLLRSHPAVDLVMHATDATPEERLGALLALEANDLTAFFDEGWAVDELLESLRIVLHGVRAMPKISRRKLLQLGAAAVISGIPIPEGRHTSEEDRAKLHQALGESIAAGWKIFHTAGNAQVLAVSHAQLYLVQQNHSLLYRSAQPLFYSGVYRLMGAALYFQGRYTEAHQAHEKAYIAALEGADPWNMAQSRSWQAYVLRECENYPEALQMADAALRLISHHHDTESIRLRARLLAFSAENAALLGEKGEVQARLDASERLLEYLPGYHEEFDQVSWLQQAGTCALNLKEYDVAVTRLQQAFNELPPQWILRVVSTAIPLARALIQQGELNRAFALAKKTLPIVRISQSPTLIQEFANYLQTELLASFCHDRSCQAFVAEAQQQLAIA
ncbi:MAG TPA: helix-turn-helix transcriptional regulator [Ktedonobacteraceae bacterium]|nr:helix-turn-helix transcriptional regulator [Ktedonobacteraceae bacterium]HZU66252.1 helix-turn-helix transcriptional regulator [Ktedonobacteraceae bacterium]